MQVEKIRAGNYVVAVSGGVDSVVLLDLLSKQKDLDLTVAHFDHGIRSNSYEDEQFVKNLAEKYKLPFISDRGELGANASEEKAREARYRFLRKVAKENNATLVLAHHKDDVLETIIINLLRGTGWRGLSSLRSTEKTIRPLIKVSKQDILDYAKKHKLNWREDPSNQDTKYLRNYVRLKILPCFSQKDKASLDKLHCNQVAVSDKIDVESSRLLGSWRDSEEAYYRYPFIMCDDSAALELLKRELGATGPQLRQALLAIKTARPGAQHRVSKNVVLKLTATNFIVSRTADMLS